MIKNPEFHFMAHELLKFVTLRKEILFSEFMEGGIFVSEKTDFIGNKVKQTSSLFII